MIHDVSMHSNDIYSTLPHEGSYRQGILNLLVCWEYSDPCWHCWHPSFCAFVAFSSILTKPTLLLSWQLFCVGPVLSFNDWAAFFSNDWAVLFFDWMCFWCVSANPHCDFLLGASHYVVNFTHRWFLIWWRPAVFIRFMPAVFARENATWCLPPKLGVVMSQWGCPMPFIYQVIFHNK